MKESPVLSRMVRYLLAVLVAISMLPAQAQWRPHTDPGRCAQEAGYITVGSSTVCIPRSASAVVSTDSAGEPAGGADSAEPPASAD